MGPWKYHEIVCYNIFKVYGKAMKFQRLEWGHENTIKLPVTIPSRFIKGPWNYKKMSMGPYKSEFTVLAYTYPEC